MATDRTIVSRLPPINSNTVSNFSPRHAKKYEGLNGPTYRLSGENVKHNLPPPSVLKPHQDTKAGTLEIWPAHATGQGHTLTAVLNKDKQLVIIDEEALGKPQMVPKPKFLEQLEGFLKKELKSLGVDTVAPNELRLQAYREVFQYLIEDFKTYQPLLAAIKNEYEMMLSHQREQIRQLEPLKQMLVTVSEQCDQKIMALREDEKEEMLEMRRENRRLYQRIDELGREQKDLEAQVERLKEELAVEYLLRRDESDARKLLIADMNDLRYQQEDAAARKSMQESEEEKDDPLTLKMALKKAREDEAAATRRLNEMEANYGDVIPRRDFEALQKQYQTLEEKIEQSKADFIKLKEEHETLLGTYKQVLQERDDYYYEFQNLKNQALTPRPEWDKCAEHIHGGMDRWKELSDGKKSKELMEIVLQEIVGGGSSDSSSSYFDGLGTDESVPIYLRYEGQVRNRRLSKRDTALFIRELWKDKIIFDSEKSDGQRSNMADFLHEYLKQRFSLSQMVIEWAYNLHDACQRYLSDERIALFWYILTGEAEEELYYQPQQIISKLLNHLTRIDLDKGNPGVLSKEEFKAALQEFFSGKDYFFLGKTDENIDALVHAAESQLEAKEQDALDYKNLFLEDDEGKMGLFIEELRKQMKDERLQYIEALRDHLRDTDPVSPDDLQKAFSVVDPYIKKPDIDAYLVSAYRVSDKEKLSEVEPLSHDVLFKRLELMNIRKHSQFEN